MRVCAGEPENVRVRNAMKQRRRLARHRTAPEQSDIDLGENIEGAAVRRPFPGRDVVDIGNRRHQSVTHDRGTRIGSETVSDRGGSAGLTPASRIASASSMLPTASASAPSRFHHARDCNRAAAVGVALEAGVDSHTGAHHAAQLAQIVGNRVQIDLEPGGTQERGERRSDLTCGHDAKFHGVVENWSTF